MKPSVEKFLKLMFQDTDTICVSDSKFGFHSIPLEMVLKDKITLVSPNKDIVNKEITSDEIVFICTNPVKGFRQDQNVYRLSNFMIEIDGYGIQKQYEYIKNLGIPISACVYSGNKSLHFLIALDEPVPTIKAYRFIYKWILNIVTLADQNIKNPSRSIRCPSNIRPDTGKEQKLLELNGKIKSKDFVSWLNKYENLKPKTRETKSFTNEISHDKLSKWVKKQLKNGIDFTHGRNRTWFALSCDLAKSGYEEEEIECILASYFKEESDFTQREWLTTIKSACNYINNKA